MSGLSLAVKIKWLSDKRSKVKITYVNITYFAPFCSMSRVYSIKRMLWNWTDELAYEFDYVSFLYEKPKKWMIEIINEKSSNNHFVAEWQMINFNELIWLNGNGLKFIIVHVLSIQAKWSNVISWMSCDYLVKMIWWCPFADILHGKVEFLLLPDRCHGKPQCLSKIKSKLKIPKFI